MEFTEEDVLQILKVVEESNVDQFYLEMGDLKLSVSKNGPLEQFQEQPSVAVISRPETPARAPVGQKGGAAALQSVASAADDEGLISIPAPLMGLFYRRPNPEAPPYVEEGQVVKADDTVGLIEVMKLFTSVKAGTPGAIARICVENGQLVEYGQTLFLVEPE